MREQLLAMAMQPDGTTQTITSADSAKYLIADERTVKSTEVATAAWIQVRVIFHDIQSSSTEFLWRKCTTGI